MGLKNKKVKMTTEEAKQIVLENIEKLFQMHKISGIIEVPSIGTYSLFTSDGAKLLILDHAKVEEHKLELERNKKAIEWINNTYNEKEKANRKPAYIS